MEDNYQLCNIHVDVQLQPNGLFDVFISEDGSSGAHYSNVTAEEIGRNVAEQVQCYAEAAKQTLNEAIQWVVRP